MAGFDPRCRIRCSALAGSYCGQSGEFPADSAGAVVLVLLIACANAAKLTRTVFILLKIRRRVA
jgi:hypothetical protein